jgi:hypothetical protein
LGKRGATGSLTRREFGIGSLALAGNRLGSGEVVRLRE